MSKKWVGILVAMWIVAAISGVIYFNFAKDVSVQIIANGEISTGEKTKEKVVIYVPDKNGKSLDKRDEYIEESQSKRDKAFKVTSKTIEVLQKESFLKSENISVLNIYFSEDTAYIDLSASAKEMDENSRENLLNVYSIVNTLTEFGNINRVKMLVNGKDGNKNLAKFYSRNTGI